MTAYTPNFALPYQTINEPPHGPDLGQKLALATDEVLADLSTRLADLEAMFGGIGPWSSYGTSGTVLTSTGSAPSLGNSTFSFEWAKLSQKTAIVRYKIVIGSTFSAGSGQYRFLLPSASSAAAVNNGAGGICRLADAGVALYLGVGMPVDTTHFAITKHGDSNELGSGGPGTAWATGDAVQGSYIYELA